MSIAFIIIACIAGFIVSYTMHQLSAGKLLKAKIVEADLSAKNLLKDAENEAKNLKKEKILEAKEEWHKRKQEFDNDVNLKKQKIQELEKQIKKREEGIENKLDIILKKEKQTQMFEEELHKKDAKLVDKAKEIDIAIENQMKKLEQVAGL
jgi:ribonuclease Y